MGIKNYLSLLSVKRSDQICSWKKICFNHANQTSAPGFLTLYTIFIFSYSNLGVLTGYGTKPGWEVRGSRRTIWTRGHPAQMFVQEERRLLRLHGDVVTEIWENKYLDLARASKHSFEQFIREQTLPSFRSTEGVVIRKKTNT